MRGEALLSDLLDDAVAEEGCSGGVGSGHGSSLPDARTARRPDTGCVHCDLITGISTLADAFQGSPITRALPGLVSDLEADPALREVFRRDYFEARRATSRAVLEHAVERGDIQGGLDMELTLDLLAAPLYYRAFFGHQPIDDGLAERTVLSVLNGVASVDWQRHHRARPAASSTGGA
ncbi:TetR-like C-terminal domain-containing protein [Plantibacter elymi (nom. nud.)]|uniref:TetR-like C-terminal domain-containing protein n=1 Tax=Plantibacter elymi (nom. nud.) TaxID=199708 RepID=UPI001F616974|nr:TetR-like C-terminal domain-containing protein [Plantibacter sp. VKM Ac-1784]